MSKKKRFISQLYLYLFNQIDTHGGKWEMPLQTTITEALGYSPSAVSKAIGLLLADNMVTKSKSKEGRNILARSRSKKQAA